MDALFIARQTPLTRTPQSPPPHPYAIQSAPDNRRSARTAPPASGFAFLRYHGSALSKPVQYPDLSPNQTGVHRRQISERSAASARLIFRPTVAHRPAFPRLFFHAPRAALQIP